MNEETLKDDLAFLRTLAQSSGGMQARFGGAYVAAGLLYGLEALVGVAQMQGWIAVAGAISTAFHLGISLVFLVVLTVLLWRGRREVVSGVAARAVNAAFAAAGTTNVALIAIIGSVAWRENSMTIWFIYPATVFALQGAAWMISFILIRRPWLAVVAVGWFGTALAMALTIDTVGYVLSVAVGLFAFMLVPGLVMMRQARRAA